MNVPINVTLTGADAEAYGRLVSLARNEFPENAQATAADILGAVFDLLAHPNAQTAWRIQDRVRIRVEQRLAQSTQEAA